jgi:3-hydroxyisobutyrate dehydrogenase-like beta-hydroxyacid dehydrogenase
VLGLGEAGGDIARGLAGTGARVKGYDPVVPAPPGVEPADGDADACRGADLVLSLTTAAEAGEALAAALAGVAGPTVYADANTAAAGQKQRLGQVAADAGVPFADIAIMAPVPGHGYRVPMLISGTGAGRAAAILTDCGASTEILPGPPGAAATRKLLRSVFYKGTAAAVVEALVAARAAGCEDWMREHIAAELAAASADTATRMEEGSYRHALRRSHEMGAAAELLGELGVPARVTIASQQWLEELVVTAGEDRAAAASASTSAGSGPRRPG